MIGSVCLCISLYILLSLPGDNSVKTSPQLRIVGGVVFYAVHVVSKERRGYFFPELFSSCSPTPGLGNYDPFGAKAAPNFSVGDPTLVYL
jgi:hypothetical protein